MESILASWNHPSYLNLAHAVSVLSVQGPDVCDVLPLCNCRCNVRSVGVGHGVAQTLGPSSNTFVSGNRSQARSLDVGIT